MFEKIRETYLEEYHGTGTLYRHKASQMEVYHIKNDSEELSCAFMFATPSRDDMGVAHILEHSVLSGSKRYPVKDPFDSVLQSSPNTYLNALTYTDKTVFPFASPLKKDFDILFGIYADAVFDPLLRKQSFEQQGIRFYENKFDGVVFNEMCGATSSEDDFVSDYCVKKLYEGTPATFKSGGDPKAIADLTYEEYVERYKQWYSPSNCRLFFFGDLDVSEYLEKLEKLYLFEENLSKWRGIKYVPSSDKYNTQQTEPIRDSVGCPIENASSVVMTWLACPTTDPVENLTLNILVDILLGDAGAPLYKAIIESDLGSDLNSMSGTDVDFPIMPFICGFTGAKKGKEDQIEAFILNELNKIVKNGLDPIQVEAAIKRQEFRIQEIKGGETPYGLTIAFKSTKNWLRGGNVEDSIIVKPFLEKIKEYVKNGPYFENWIKKNLIDNPKRCLLTVYYDKNAQKETDELLAGKLKARLEKYSKEELESGKKAFDGFVSSEDSEEALKSIERIKISDMPTKIPTFNQTEEKVGKSTLLKFPLFTNKIVYANLAFNTLHLNLEEKKLLPLLTRVMEITSTSNYDYVKLGALIKLYMGGFSIGFSNGLDNENNQQSLIYIKAKMLEEDTQKAFELITEIVNNCDLKNPERIQAAINDICTDFESEYLYNANRFALIKAGSLVSASMLENEVTGGTTSYLYFKGLLDSKDELKSLSVQLTNLKNKVFNQSNLTLQIACQEEAMNNAVNYAEKMIYTLQEGEKVRSTNYNSKEFKLTKDHHFLTVSSGPAYNVLLCYLPNDSQKELVAKLLYTSALGNGKLWDIVRGQNGAYGAFSSVLLQEKVMAFISYRDPNIDKTFDAYVDCLDYQISDEQKDFVIVGIIGKELKPLSPQAKALEAFKRHLYKMTDSLYLERRKDMLSITAEDIEKARLNIKKNVQECSVKTTVCGQKMVKQEKGKIITRVGL